MTKTDDKKNFIYVVVSSGITFLEIVLLGFFLPKMTSIDTYAGYKTYTLYITYSGILHWGFINGVYLRYGDIDYHNLPFCVFRRYTRFLLGSQIVAMVCFFMIFVFADVKDCSPIFFVVINILPVNMNCYFSLIDQFSRRLRRDSIIMVVYNTGILIACTSLILNRCDNYVSYLGVVTIINYARMFVYLISSKEIVWGQCERIKSVYKEIFQCISRGIFVLSSEYAGLIILGVDSIFINVLFSVQQYATYAFAVSIYGTLFQILNVVSRMMFPYLKRIAKDMVKVYYLRITNILLVLSSAVLGLMFFISNVVEFLLPQYFDSIEIASIICVIIIFRTLLELVCFNIYKVMNLEKAYMTNNVLALLLGIVTDIIAYLIFGTAISIAVASVMTYIVWYLFTDRYLRKKLSIKETAIYKYSYIVIIISVYCGLNIVGLNLVSIAIYYFVIAVSLFLLKKYIQ